MNNNKLFKQLSKDCDEIINQLEDISQNIISWLYVEDVFETRLEYLKVYIEPNHGFIDDLLSKPLQTVSEYLEIPPSNNTMYRINYDSLLINNGNFSVTFSKDSRYFDIKRFNARNSTRSIPIKIYSVDFLKIIEPYFKLFISISQIINPTLDQIMKCIEDFFNKVKDICNKIEVNSNG